MRIAQRFDEVKLSRMLSGGCFTNDIYLIALTGTIYLSP
jgi:hypothetical protein